MTKLPSQIKKEQEQQPMTNNARESDSKIELACMRLLVAVLKPTATTLLFIVLLATVQAGDRHSKHSKNYIMSRQEYGQVSGVPTSRRIIGKREIDIYRNGLMFEKDNVVGVKR